MTDPIADMLTRLRNAAGARKPEFIVPYSRLKSEIARILEKEGYIAGLNSKRREKVARISRSRINLSTRPAPLRVSSVSRPGLRR